jgi:DNA-binding NtrC family response regulator
MTVLLIDDDDAFRSGLRALLEEDEHTVVDFGSLAALPALKTFTTVGALITDYQLRNGSESGVDFARRFHAAHPDVPIVIVTAYASEHLARTVTEAPYLSLLRKPVRYDDLHALLHR